MATQSKAHLLPLLELGKVKLPVFIGTCLHLPKEGIYALSCSRRHPHILQVLVELLQHLRRSSYSCAKLWAPKDSLSGAGPLISDSRSQRSAVI